MSECIFCAIVAGEAPAEIIYTDDHCLAFLDIAPVARGHTLVIPKIHRADLSDIGPDRAAQVMRAAITVAGMLQDRLEPAGMNLLQATGPLAGQTVFHFHLHVLPRYTGGEIQVHFPQRRVADRDELGAVADQIRSP